jgi:hypothetical protein
MFISSGRLGELLATFKSQRSGVVIHSRDKAFSPELLTMRRNEAHGPGLTAAADAAGNLAAFFIAC